MLFHVGIRAIAPAFARAAVIASLLPLPAAQAAPLTGRLPGQGNPPSANPPPVASQSSGNEMTYRGFVVDLSLVASAPNRAEIEGTLKKQLDIVAGCDAKPEIMTFFRNQRIKLKFGGEDGGGRFSSAGVEIDATPQPPQKPIVLHELLHAMHARYMPDGARNADIKRFYERAKSTEAYPANEYVLKNAFEFFAVTGSLYLWGFVARPPHDRETLKAKQPVYYKWLGELFGVQK